MRRFPLIVAAGLGLSGGACQAEAPVQRDNGRANAVPPARDGDIAIAEELAAARKEASVEAYDLFIARHPGHPLEAAARGEREALIARGRDR